MIRSRRKAVNRVADRQQDRGGTLVGGSVARDNTAPGRNSRSSGVSALLSRRSAVSEKLNRRSFAALAAGSLVASGPPLLADEKPRAEPPKGNAGPTEAPFERDYTPPTFKPS